MNFNWICPHCLRAQTVVDARYHQETSGFAVGSLAGGPFAIERIAIACSNPDCQKLTLRIRVGKDVGGSSAYIVSPKELLFSEQLIPRGAAKPQPAYIPAPLVEDYTEACLIRDLSPKASATLTRRCLQGMIRDFAGISKPRLIDEIKALKVAVDDGTADRSVTSETVAAIDHVRSLGNIGAHMEADINVIVPVDSGEAQVMIELVELLFDEWYGARYRRNEKLAKIAAIRTHKDEIKRAVVSSPPAPVAETNEVATSAPVAR
jgi:hypothetical protein